MIYIIIAIAILLLIVFFAGPKLKITTTIKPISLPENLDDYLINKEKEVKNLVPGAEKKIIWANNKNERTKYSIIFFHGFTTSRQEISPVTEIIGEKIEANIFFTRLKEHGIDDIEALGRANINDWINDAWEAYQIAKRLGDKIILISMSGGAPLSLWLCLNQERPDDIAANVILSPMFEPHDPKAQILLLPWGNLLIQLVVGKYRKMQPLKEEHRKLMACQYPSKALVTMMGLCKLSWSVDLKSLTVPTLCMYNPNDDVVSIPRMKKEMEKVPSCFKKIVPVNAKNHCIAGDAISPENNEFVIGEILQFLSDRRIIT